MKLQVKACAITNKNRSTLDDFVDRVCHIITSSENNSIIVFPEYCWGDIPSKDVEARIDKIADVLMKKQQVVLGSHPIYEDNIVTNSAIYLNGLGDRYFVPKMRVLQNERDEKNVQPGMNPGIIKVNGLHILVLICADLWNAEFLIDTLQNGTIDLILVPSFTVVPPGFSEYARTQWYSLAITRSREFIVPLVVADHPKNTPIYDVGMATCIADPSIKHNNIKSYDDFLQLPNHDIAMAEIDFDKIAEYREYRHQKGIYRY